MPYIQITIVSSPEEADLFAENLEALDAVAVTMEDAKDDAIYQLAPEETPLWDFVNVKALFETTVSPRTIINTIKTKLNRTEPINYRIEKIADQDWVRLTQQHFKPQCYAEKLWICPNWYEEPLAGKVVRIDPGLAFGTGTHPTTSLCLEWLAHNPPLNKTVIDFGCGSGILALAAAKLGAEQVIAIDHDQQALIATKNNMALNPDIQHKISISNDKTLPSIKADVIVANILANPLIELEPTITRLMQAHGSLVLSGILEHEIQFVAQAYAEHFTLQDAKTLDQWALLTFTR